MVTIKDVAKAANVAPSTVSRVISGNKNISAATADRVREKMEALGYQLNNAARTLATNKSFTIGLISKSSDAAFRQNPFFADVLAGIMLSCKERGYATILTTSKVHAHLRTEVEQMVRAHSIDGFILLYSKRNDPVEDYLQSVGVPYVVIGKPLEETDVVHIDNDNMNAAYRLTNYVISCGHNTIVMISDSKEFEVSKDRATGFEQAIAMHNAHGHLYYSDGTRAQMYDLVTDIFHTHPHVGAIITADAMLNLQLLSVLYELNRRVPDDIQTATFNDAYINETACPPQTTMHIFPEVLGEAAGRAIIDIVKDPKTKRIHQFVDTTLIVRQSTRNIFSKECE